MSNSPMARRKRVASPKPDPTIQYHLSVEPDLLAGVPFSEQVRTHSSAGARGEAVGEGIYTTTNPGHWFTQMAYEEVGELPRHVYLVKVAAPSEGTVWSAHQDLSPPEEVVVLAKLMEAPEDEDKPLDVSRLTWLAEMWLKANPQTSDPEPEVVITGP